MTIQTLPPHFTVDGPHLIAVVGPSGTGKTSLLSALPNHIVEPPAVATGLADRTVPLAEAWPETPEQNIRRLTAAGLADPFTWCRLPSELSAGQLARFDALDLLYGTTDLVVIDEFLTTLDSVTARATAYALSRVARSLAKIVIVATSRSDYLADLSPDVVIHTAWDATPVIQDAPPPVGRCTVLDELSYRPGNRSDWNQLRRLHYAAADPATIHSVHVLKHPDLQHPAAVAVLSFPDLHSSARNLATQDAYKIHDAPTNVHRLNREVLRLSRIVVAPEFRGCGVAALLLHNIAATTTARWIECTTALGKHSRFLEHVGFREVPTVAHAAEAELLDWAAQEQVPAHLSLDAQALREWADSLSVRRRRTALRRVWHHYHQFVLHRRTRAARPLKIPDPNDPHWPEAWQLASMRLTDRPSYFILGPLDQQTSHDAPQSAERSLRRATTPAGFARAFFAANPQETPPCQTPATTAAASPLTRPAGSPPTEGPPGATTPTAPAPTTDASGTVAGEKPPASAK